MDEATAEVVKEIAQQRRHLGDEIEQLERKVQSTLDWRALFKRDPLTAAGMVLGVGFVLAGLFTRHTK